MINKGLEDCPKERNALRDKPGAVSDYELFFTAYNSSIDLTVIKLYLMTNLYGLI